VIPVKRKAGFAAKLFYFFLLAVGLSFYSYLYLKCDSFSIDKHSFNPSVLFILSSSVVIFIILAFLWRFTALIERKFCHNKLSFFLNQGLWAFMPFSLSLFSPFVLAHYLTASDLKIRLDVLGFLMIIGFLIIKLVQASRYERVREFTEKIWNGFKRISTRKKILFLFIVSLVIYHLCSLVLVHNGKEFTGDEPYYLLTTQSLYEDQDINVADDYADEEYTYFYPKEKHKNLKLGVYARTGKKGSQYIYPINLPGISVLMLPHYGLSRFFNQHTRVFILSVSLSIWAALLGIQIFLFTRELWGKEKISLLSWFLYSFTVPILFYSNHLYPEIVVAFFSLYVFRKVRSKKPLSVFQIVLCGFFLSSLFWLGLKYNMIFWPLLLVSVYLLVKEHKVRWRIVYFLIFPAVSMVLFYYFVYSLYGTINPISIYEGIMTPEKTKAFKELVLSVPAQMRIDSFLDYFLDQRDGLLLYAPFYFFMFVGMVEMFRRSRRDLVFLLFISLPFLFNYAFLTHRQGFCPQGRVLTPLSWLMFWLVLYFFVYNRKKIYSSLFYICCAMSVGIALVLLIHPSFLYQSTTHIHTFRAGALFLFLSNLNLYVPKYLPSFIKVNNLGYMPNYIWLGLIAVFILGYLYKNGCLVNKKIRPTPVFAAIGFIFLFYSLVLFPREVLIHPKKANYITNEKLTFYNLSRSVHMKKAGEFFISQDDRSYRFFFTSWREIRKLEVVFSSPKNKYRIECRYFDRLFFKGLVSEQEKSVIINKLPYYPFKNTHLYMLHIRINRVSPDSSVTPFFLSVKPQY